jgi:hypothetical protein
MRDTFMKVGQSLMVKKQLVTEKGLKEKMIHSVMPPKVATWLMKEGHAEDLNDENSAMPMSSVSQFSKFKKRFKKLLVFTIFSKIFQPYKKS